MNEEIKEIKIISDGVSYTVRIKKTSKAKYDYVTCMNSEEYRNIVKTPTFNAVHFKEALKAEKIIVSQSCPPEDARDIKDIAKMSKEDLIEEINQMTGLPSDIIYMYAHGFSFSRASLDAISEFIQHNRSFLGISVLETAYKSDMPKPKKESVRIEESVLNFTNEKIIEIQRSDGKNKHKCTLSLNDAENKIYNAILGGYTQRVISRIIRKLLIDKLNDLIPYSDKGYLSVAYPMQAREVVQKKNIKSSNDKKSN